MAGRMAGKIALVTGGGGGIGGATGRLFCAEGAKVLLVDRNADMLNSMADEIRAGVPNAAVNTFAADVSDFAQATGAVQAAVKAFGGLNTLVSNAAIRNHDSVAQADRSDWEKLVSTNLIGAANFCKAAVGELRKHKNSSVVIVSSCYAVMGRKGMPIYDATKAALLSLTRSFAWEEAEHGIRVNAVCPGGTLTPFTVGRGIARGLTEEQMRAQVKPDSLLRRWAEPMEVAYPILWLASDEGSYITGTTLMVDAGLSIM
jgi:meso-butanediol dehydrogenase/(S,S)-butanediol dehydrogenase/diacetyl reductase